jgi:UrcA family protein
MKTTLVKRHALGGLAALAVALTANLACAAPGDFGPRTALVHYSDLDLSQPKDARRLYGRIKAAAREVCDNAPYKDLSSLRQYEMCVAHAVANAVQFVNATEVTRVHEGDARLVSRELSASR